MENAQEHFQRQAPMFGRAAQTGRFVLRSEEKQRHGAFKYQVNAFSIDQRL
jgi:hypothetical protein